MIRYTLTLMTIILSITSCLGQKKESENDFLTPSGNFTIIKIDSTTTYYSITCLKNKQLYKILSKKNQNTLHKIKTGESYFLNLKYFTKELQNDNPLTSFNPLVPCFFIDENTEVCVEKNILGPYFIERK
ncbi:hypothetical protein [Aureivirga sp. CE67]|uniref:hypothetical protein n=1 Tax=Aureivirga sp. CE67 TaxID=1788983 RepID=UPI0018CBE8F3|nr:hypothetical protein [Aureivirga sp. CE67]